MDKIYYKNKEKVIQGKLSITKIQDGIQEKLQEFNNIPVQGLGYSLARLFASKSTTSNLDNFRFNYFQLGTDFIDYIPQGDTNKSLFYQLASALNLSDYGTDIDSIVSLEQQIYTIPFTDISDLETSTISNAIFVEIPNTRVTRIGDSVIKIQLLIDKNMAVGKSLQEIGLFIKNPDENLKTDKAILAAYKYFKPISKTNQFSLIFDWVIQIVDLSVEQDWSTGSSQVTYPPALVYNSTGFVIDASSGTFTQSPILTRNLVANTFALYRYNGGQAFPADTFSIDIGTGIISYTVISGTNEALGKGIITIRATPSDPSFGNRITADVPYNILYTGGLGNGGTGATGGTGMTGTGDGSGVGISSGTVYKGPRIGDIDWVMPYTGSQYDYATSQVVVLKAIMPTSKLGGDFFSSPGLDKWLVEGGTAQFTTASCIAQVHSVTRDPSGYPTNVEVIFSALASQPIATPSDSQMNYQTFRLFQASGNTPSSTLNLSTISRLHFQITDTSGFSYNCKFFTTTSGVLSFNPDSNLSITSSLIKNGPYLKTYRFYGRTVPRGYGGTAGQWNINDPDHEVKPFGPSVHAYVTIRLNQEVANIDFRISNGHIHKSGYGGVVADPITYEPESSNIPGWIGQHTAHVVGNFYYNSMFVDFGSDSSAISYIDKWDVNLSQTSGKYALVSAFPTAADPNNQPVHCLPSMKSLIHRFGVFKTANVSSLTFAKHETKLHYQSFPKISTGRSYQKIRAWGYHGEILPDFPDTFFTGQFQEDIYYNNNGIIGRSGQRRLVSNMFNDMNGIWATGDQGSYPHLGLGLNPPKSFNSPFMLNDVQDGGNGGLANIILTPGSRQLYEELDAINVRYESTIPRMVSIFTVSGNPLTLKEVIQQDNPDAITDVSGLASYYRNNPGANPNFGGPSYSVNKGNWGITGGFHCWEYPSWFLRALSNSKKSQPNTPNPVYNAYALYDNKCPYFGIVTQLYRGTNDENGIYNAFGPFDFAHQERGWWSAYTLAIGRNDSMAKEDLWGMAEHYQHIAPPYIITSYNKFARDNPGVFGNQDSFTYNTVTKTIESCTNVFSGTGYDVFTGRGTGLEIQMMVNYWTLANDSWRSNNQVFFDNAVSGLSFGYSRENGAFLPGTDATEGSPPANLLGNALANNNLYRRFAGSVLPSGKQYWYHNPLTFNANSSPQNVAAGLVFGPDGTNNTTFGGAIAASSNIYLLFHEMYLKEATYSLARLQLSSNSPYKQILFSAVALGCSTAFTSPSFGTMSGVLNDPLWLTNGVPTLIADGHTQAQVQAFDNYFRVGMSDPANREHGVGYWTPMGPNRNIYTLGSFGYGSGIGQKRTYTTSDSGFSNSIMGTWLAFPDGGTAGPGRNRVDIWPLLTLGIIASLGDNDVSLSSQAILSSNYFIQKGPENLATDFDVLVNPTTSQYFQNSDFTNLINRAGFGILNTIAKENYERGLHYNATYIAYLLKFMGLI